LGIPGNHSIDFRVFSFYGVRKRPSLSIIFQAVNHSMTELKSVKKIRSALFIIGILLLFLPPGVLSEDVNATAALESRSVFTLGAILPLSGPYADYADRILRSMIMAGGFFDSAKETFIELYIEDSQMHPGKAKQGMLKLAERESLLAVIGPLSSDEAFAAAGAAEGKGIPLITLTKNEEVTKVGPHCFNIVPSTRNQLRHLVHYALDDRRLNRIAILFPDVSSGRDAAEFFRDEVNKSGRKVSHFISYQGENTDFTKEIETLVGKKLDTSMVDADARKINYRINFDGLFIPDSAIRVSQVISQLSFYNIRGFQLLGNSSWNVPDTIMAHRDLFEGAIFVDGYLPYGIIPETGEFADRYYAAYAREPEPLDAYAYEAMNIVLGKIDKSSGMTREKLRQELAGIKVYPGIRGKITADPLRIMDSKPFIITVKDGERVQIVE
jgi:branched-chain amino acid transport system substrate-binding protein